MHRSAQAIVEELNQLDEHISLEAKGGLGESLLESICAFANEPGLGGGTILIGVERDPDALIPFYDVVGVDDADQCSSTLASQCASVFNTPLRPVIRSEKVNEKTVLVVEVAEAEGAEKPIYFQRKGLPKGAFRRIGSTDQHCTEDDLAALFGGRIDQTFDDRVIPTAQMTDIDPEAVEHYRRLRGKVNPEAEELSWDNDELLQALSAVRLDHGMLRPTLTGVLLFGTRFALRRLLPTVRIDYIRVPGREWIEDPDSRFTTTDMRGPLLQLVQRAQDQVFEDLPKGFALEEGHVQARSESLPARVLREAIVNAVMHASYRVHEPVQIIRYANRLEIRNPGYSLKNEEQLGRPGSRLRNPKLAAVFHETNLAETKGSGIRTMRRLMDEAGFVPPTFESDRTADTFTARLLLHHFLTPGDLQWLAALGEPSLSDAQKRALIFVRESGAIDNQVCRQINGMDTLAASQELRRLRDVGLLEMKGKGAATYYLPTQRLRSCPKIEPAPGALTQTPHRSGETHQLPSKTHQLGPETHQLGPETHQFGPKTHQHQGLRNALPEDLKRSIAQLGKRPAHARMQTVIKRLCTWKPLRADELAFLLGRDDPKHLRRAHLNPLLASGKLVHTIRDMPNHPNQGYTIPETGQPEPEKHE